MIYKVASFTEFNKLLSFPETGMGYQIIEAVNPYSYSKRKYAVFNSELVFDFDPTYQNVRKSILNESLSYVLKNAQTWEVKTESISLVTKKQLIESRNLSEIKKTLKNRKSSGKGAAESPKEHANGKDIFVRISAWENDKRIDWANKKLLAGSYTTTDSDYLSCVSTNDDPIDRYALPSDDKIEWAFYIQPSVIDVIQKGIVQPAFGHDGGGEEVLFENGSSNNTLLSKRKYGQ